MTGPINIRKRPEATQAYPYNGTNGRDIAAWVGADAEWTQFDGLVIHTDRGDVIAQPGDIIIRGLVGEHYPITPGAFAAGWEQVGE